MSVPNHIESLGCYFKSGRRVLLSLKGDMILEKHFFLVVDVEVETKKEWRKPGRGERTKDFWSPVLLPMTYQVTFVTESQNGVGN